MFETNGTKSIEANDWKLDNFLQKETFETLFQNVFPRFA